MARVEMNACRKPLKWIAAILFSALPQTSREACRYPVLLSLAPSGNMPFCPSPFIHSTVLHVALGIH